MNQTKQQEVSSQEVFKDGVKNYSLKHCLRKTKNIFNLKRVNMALFCFIIVGIVYYLTGVNDLMVKGFRLGELKNEVNRLSDENKNIEVEITSLGSFNDLTQRAETLNMIAVGELDYITETIDVMARK